MIMLTQRNKFIIVYIENKIMIEENSKLNRIIKWIMIVEAVIS